MSSVERYKIAVPQTAIDRLHKKLGVTDFPDELEDAGWDYGAPLAEVKKLVEYWQNGYDWRKQEAKLNELPNHMTTINVDGFGDLKIHFLHQPSSNKNAIPLLFNHGWPGSFLEVSKLLPLLADTSDGAAAFHVVAPSMPNFGFSQGIKKRGFGMAQYAQVGHKLMLQLGYKQYVTQGGDWGFWVTRTMGRLFPESCKASHINMSPPAMDKDVTPALNKLESFSAQEQASLQKLAKFHSDGAGYSTEQGTKPQTIGYGLHDSPVLLLSWIYEKLHDWVDDYPWTHDEILTWVSLYWFSTAGPAASVRIYYEFRADEANSKKLTEYVPEVKLGIMYNHQDMETSPKAWARDMGDVVFESENERGGHFAAWEKPEGVARDLKAMFARGAKASVGLGDACGFDG